MRYHEIVVPSDCTISNTTTENRRALQSMKRYLKPTFGYLHAYLSALDDKALKGIVSKRTARQDVNRARARTEVKVGGKGDVLEAATTKASR